jgi:hypothetical protein
MLILQWLTALYLFRFVSPCFRFIQLYGAYLHPIDRRGGIGRIDFGIYLHGQFHCAMPGKSLDHLGVFDRLAKLGNIKHPKAMKIDQTFFSVAGNFCLVQV